ncbi:nuclease-related domain-containing protein [Neobacillus sp. GCM10023253]|uniref:nuclease-related domain-containing protein n=1 Tax=Neobacillus sp. GCM10023253 TaxID=3252644 RepID=UPI00361DE49F
MFDLELYKPIPLEQTEALIRRITQYHPKRPNIEKEIKKLYSGYQGEKKLRYFLGLIPDKKYHIFHGLRLPIGNTYFQIDALLLSPKLTLIIESKNYAGTITIEKDQLIQEVNESKEVYDNPLEQAIRHKILLQYLLEKYQLPAAPIEVLAVMTRSSSVIKIAPGYHEAEKKIVKAGNLLRKIEELENRYTAERIDQKTIGKIKRLVLSKHTPLKIDVLRKFDIGIKEIIQGVCCPRCLHIPMQYRRQKWYCPVCELLSQDAYIEAINDHFLIVKNSLTNRELREFLHIPSSRQATYLLNLKKLPSTGSNKGRIYYQPN